MVKARLRLINDTALGYLLAITQGYWESQTNGCQFTFNISDPAPVSTLADLNDVLEVTITTSRVTEQKYHELLKEKQFYEEMTVESNYRSSYTHDKEKEEYLRQFIQAHKPYETPLKQEEGAELANLYPDIHNTLVYVIRVPTDKLVMLKKFLQLYQRMYANKELQLQERLFLPSVQAEPLLTIINDPNFVTLHGKKRLLISSIQNPDLSPLFFHTLMYLSDMKLIKINNIILYHTTGAEVEIDNLVDKQDKTLQIPDKPYWQDNFVWSGNRFVFGDYGFIEFDSRDRILLFRKLTDAKGSWVKTSELNANKGNDFARPTISQIESRFTPELRKHASIPSQEDDDMTGKPEGRGAYRIRFLPKPK